MPLLETCYAPRLLHIMKRWLFLRAVCPATVGPCGSVARVPDLPREPGISAQSSTPGKERLGLIYCEIAML
jgi:hypothetical protein